MHLEIVPWPGVLIVFVTILLNYGFIIGLGLYSSKVNLDSLYSYIDLHSASIDGFKALIYIVSVSFVTVIPDYILLKLSSLLTNCSGKGSFKGGSQSAFLDNNLQSLQK